MKNKLYMNEFVKRKSKFIASFFLGFGILEDSYLRISFS